MKIIIWIELINGSSDLGTDQIKFELGYVLDK